MGGDRSVRGYLIGALAEIERTALFSATVDWAAVHRDAGKVLTAAHSYADTHEFLTDGSSGRVAGTAG